MRRSRCILLVLLVLVVHLFVWFVFRSRLDVSLLESVLPMHKPDFESLVFDKFDELFVTAKLNDNLNAEDAFRLFKVDLSDTGDNEVTLPHLFLDAADAKNPGVHQFDPRFTMGIVLDHLNTQLHEGADVNALALPFFHWGDWTDLSVLHEYMFSPTKNKCAELFDSRSDSLPNNNKWYYRNPATFCIDDSIAKSDMESLLETSVLSPDTVAAFAELKKDPLSTGFHVFRFPGRSEAEIKILQAKSYLNDYMPQPLSIVFLLPHEITNGKVKQSGAPAVKVSVGQGSTRRQRLINTDFLANYKKKHAQLESSGITVNAKQLLKTFIQYGKYGSPLDSTIEYEKHLRHEMFVDNSTAIFHELQQRKDELSAHELNYFNALETSLSNPYPLKYFYEALIHHKKAKYEFGAHYDWRFFNGIVNMSEFQGPSLFGLIKSWFQFTNSYNFTTWIAHGSLLSWFWNGMTFPWDIDFDVQMPIQDLHNLCRDFNQSLIVDTGHDGDTELRFGRYMLDCGTYISRRTRNNGNNNIDARFIEVDSGLYVDITGLAVSDTRMPVRYDSLLPGPLSRKNQDAKVAESDRNNYLQAYNCRNNHFARLQELTPLKLTYFEGQLTYIPNEYRQLLIDEYKELSLTFRKFGPMTFVDRLQLWDTTNNMVNFIKKKYNLKAKDLKRYNFKKSPVNRVPGDAKIIITERFRDDEDYLEYLAGNQDFMIEYLLTKDITALHLEEKKMLDSRKSTKNLLIDKDGASLFKPIRHDPFVYRAQKSKYSFIKANEEIVRMKAEISSGKANRNEEEKPRAHEEPTEEAEFGDTVPEHAPPPQQAGLQTDQDLKNSAYTRKGPDIV